MVYPYSVFLVLGAAAPARAVAHNSFCASLSTIMLCCEAVYGGGLWRPVLILEFSSFVQQSHYLYGTALYNNVPPRPNVDPNLRHVKTTARTTSPQALSLCYVHNNIVKNVDGCTFELHPMFSSKGQHYMHACEMLPTGHLILKHAWGSQDIIFFCPVNTIH
jgi:hypothetical protein